MKGTRWIAAFWATITILLSSSCSSKNVTVDDDKPKPPTSEKPIESIVSVAVTRFKNSTDDKTGISHDGKTVCNVPEKTIVQLKTKPQLADDEKHVFVVLANPLVNCSMMQGYFYGPHLLGDNWRARFSDEPVAPPSDSTTYNANWGQKIVNGVKGVPGTYGKCYRYVALHLDRAGVASYYDPVWAKIGEESAYMFGDWGSKAQNAAELKKEFGLKYDSSYNSKPNKAPIGSVLSYRPGACGYNATHGHIEIIVSAGRACSDFCQSVAMASKSCQPRVFIPVGR